VIMVEVGGGGRGVVRGDDDELGMVTTR